MALIAMASANGSPGVTTTALGLALEWPRPVILVDADPTGARAVSAGYFRGGQMPNPSSIVDLAVSHRNDTLHGDLPHMLSRIPNTHVDFLNGTNRHTQARSLQPLWEPLAATFKSLERNGQDVIVDLGRLGLEGSGFKLFTAADLALLVTRTTLPALVAAASWAPTLRDIYGPTETAQGLNTLLIGAGQPYSAREAGRVLKIPVLDSVAWDPPSAGVYSHGASPPKKAETASLPKSLKGCVSSIQTAVDKTRAELGVATPENGDLRG